MATIYLIRHGQAGFGTQNYDALSPLGQTQAQLLGAWLRTCQVQPMRVWSGSMQRQRQTATHCASSMWASTLNADDGGLNVDERLNEFDYLDILSAYIPNCTSDAALVHYLTQQTDDPRRVFQKIFAQAVAHWVGSATKIDGTPYRETWPAFQQRTQAVLQDVVTQVRDGERDGERDAAVLLFTSGGVISAMVQPLLGISDARIFDLNHSLLNTGISRLRVGRQRVRLDYLNACPHLESQAQPDLQTHR